MSFDIFGSLFSNLWSIFLVIVFFGGLIFVYGLGHFLTAKRQGLKVERFSIGFGPKIFSWKKGETEYRVSLFPFGGYVALPQLSDMSASETKSKLDSQLIKAISYSDKIVVLIGAVLNLIFAFSLACIIWIVGQLFSNEQLINTMRYIMSEGTDMAVPAYEPEFRSGDKVLAVNGIKMEYDDIEQYLVTWARCTDDRSPEVIFTIERDGKVEDVTVNLKSIELVSLKE